MSGRDEHVDADVRLKSKKRKRNTHRRVSVWANFVSFVCVYEALAILVNGQRVSGRDEHVDADVRLKYKKRKRNTQRRVSVWVNFV